MTPTPNPTHHEAPVHAGAFVCLGAGRFKYQAWCDKCQDGYNGSRVLAEDWRQLHNKLKHTEES